MCIMKVVTEAWQQLQAACEHTTEGTSFLTSTAQNTTFIRVTVCQIREEMYAMH